MVTGVRVRVRVRDTAPRMAGAGGRAAGVLSGPEALASVVSFGQVWWVGGVGGERW